MKRYLPLITLIALAVSAFVLNYNGNIVADTLSYFKVSTNGSAVINGQVGSNGWAAVTTKGSQFFTTDGTPIPVSGNVIVLTPLPTQAPAEITPIAMATVLATAVPTAFGTPSVTNAAGWKHAYVTNNTNQIIWCAFSGSTTPAIPVPVGATWWNNFKANDTKMTGGIACIHPSTLPTSGDIELGGW